MFTCQIITLKKSIKYILKLQKLIESYLFGLFQLLSEQRFQCIEKIKTIGETYMAAAGIKPESQVSIGNKKNINRYSCILNLSEICLLILSELLQL